MERWEEDGKCEHGDEQSHPHPKNQMSSSLQHNLVEWYQFYGLEPPWNLDEDMPPELRLRLWSSQNVNPLLPFVIEFRRKFRHYRIPKLTQTVPHESLINYPNVIFSSIITGFSPPLGIDNQLNIFTPSSLTEDSDKENEGNHGRFEGGSPRLPSPTTGLLSTYWTFTYHSHNGAVMVNGNKNHIFNPDILIIQPEICDTLDLELMQLCDMI